MQDVNWCRSLLERLDERVWETRARGDMFKRQIAEIERAWNDSASRQVMQRYVHPFVSNTEQYVERLRSQQSKLHDAVAVLQDAGEDEIRLHELARTSREFIDRIEREMQALHCEVDAAKNYTAEADDLSRQANALTKDLGAP